MRAIHVRNGQRVAQGQLLIELDPTLASADEAQATQTLLAARIARRRATTRCSPISQGRPAALRRAAGHAAEIVARTRTSFVRSAIAEYEARARRAAPAARRAQRRARRRAGRDRQAARDACRSRPAARGARASWPSRAITRGSSCSNTSSCASSMSSNIDVQERQRRAGARGDRHASTPSCARCARRSARPPSTELAEANDKAGLASEELRKSARRRQFQQLRAPVDGVVQQLAVHTVGGVVQPAQPLMVIVPDGDARSRSRRRSSTRTSASSARASRCAVKLEAFNFTDYGLIEGTSRRSAATRSTRASSRRRAARRQGPAGPAGPGLCRAHRLACAPSDPRRSPLCDRVRPGHGGPGRDQDRASGGSSSICSRRSARPVSRGAARERVNAGLGMTASARERSGTAASDPPLQAPRFGDRRRRGHLLGAHLLQRFRIDQPGDRSGGGGACLPSPPGGNWRSRWRSLRWSGAITSSSQLIVARVPVLRLEPDREDAAP